MRRFVLIVALGLGLAAQGVAPSTSPTQLTLQQALAMARANSPDFQAALVAEGIAQGDKTIARAALLPSVNYLNTFTYTQAGRAIANNGVHEYLSQGNVHEAIGWGETAALKRADAALALARAQTEIAARGLAATVTNDFYTFVASEHKIATAQQALTAANQYLNISQEREHAGEVAHADVVKAQIETQQKQRDLEEAGLAHEQARLALAVLLYRDFNLNFTAVDDLEPAPPLPDAARIQTLAGARNPSLAAAQAQLAQARQDIGIAHANFLPTLTLDYYYGIDANQIALRNQFGQPNLGSIGVGTLNIPIFDWGANRAKLHQSNLRAQQAQRALSQAQRQLLANLQGFYAEAATARSELATLASSRDLAQEALRLSALRYQDGEATILELVDAQNTLTLARNAYDDGLVRYRVALANLQTLTGVF